MFGLQINPLKSHGLVGLDITVFQSTLGFLDKLYQFHFLSGNNSTISKLTFGFRDNEFQFHDLSGLSNYFFQCILLHLQKIIHNSNKLQFVIIYSLRFIFFINKIFVFQHEILIIQYFRWHIFYYFL